jgi:hypothetical protein
MFMLKITYKGMIQKYKIMTNFLTYCEYVLM